MVFCHLWDAWMKQKHCSNDSLSKFWPNNPIDLVLGSHQTWFLSSFDADKDREYVDLRCCDRCCQARRIAQSTFLSQPPRLWWNRTKPVYDARTILTLFRCGSCSGDCLPSTQLADLASCGFGRCGAGAFDSWIIGFNQDFAGHWCTFLASCWVS